MPLCSHCGCGGIADGRSGGVAGKVAYAAAPGFFGAFARDCPTQLRPQSMFSMSLNTAEQSVLYAKFGLIDLCAISCPLLALASLTPLLVSGGQVIPYLLFVLV